MSQHDVSSRAWIIDYLSLISFQSEFRLFRTKKKTVHIENEKSKNVSKISTKYVIF